MKVSDITNLHNFLKWAVPDDCDDRKDELLRSQLGAWREYTWNRKLARAAGSYPDRILYATIAGLVLAVACVLTCTPPKYGQSTCPSGYCDWATFAMFVFMGFAAVTAIAAHPGVVQSSRFRAMVRNVRRAREGRSLI